MRASIVIATYNGEKYILEQLQSLIKQTVLPYEIVISDDNSTDNTLQVINKFIQDNSNKDIIFKVLINSPNNSGVVGNFENAVKNTTGDIVFFCDQDDIWVKNKIERVIEVFKKTNTSAVFHNAQILLQKENDFELTNDTTYSHICNFSSFDSEGIYIFKNREYLPYIASTCIALGMSICIDRNFLLSCLPFSKGMGHDDWIEFCAITQNSCVAIKDILAYYRIHNSNTSGLPQFRTHTISQLITKLQAIRKKSSTSIKKLYVFGKDKKKYLEENNVEDEAVNTHYNFFSNLRVTAVSKNKISSIYTLAKLYKAGHYQQKTMYYQDIIFVLLHTKKARLKFISTFDSYCR